MSTRITIALLLLSLPSLASAGNVSGQSAEAPPEALDVLFAIREGKPAARRYLRRMLEYRRTKLLACYRKARPKVADGVWTGAVTMRRKRGMRLHQTRSTLGDAKMVRCVEGVLGGMILDRFGIFRLTLAFVRLPVATSLPPSALVALRPTTRGALSRMQIQRVIRKNMRRVKYCYEKALARHVQLAGKVSMSFTIGPDGRVTSARVKSSTLKLGGLGRCLERVILSMRFPKPTGGGSVKVTYPFRFRPAP